MVVHAGLLVMKARVVEDCRQMHAVLDHHGVEGRLLVGLTGIDRHIERGELFGEEMGGGKFVPSDTPRVAAAVVVQVVEEPAIFSHFLPELVEKIVSRRHANDGDSIGQ